MVKPVFFLVYGKSTQSYRAYLLSKLSRWLANAWSLLTAVCGESTLAIDKASMVPPTFRLPSSADLILPLKLYPPLGKKLG